MRSAPIGGGAFFMPHYALFKDNTAYLGQNRRKRTKEAQRQKQWNNGLAKLNNINDFRMAN
jgi:hypothetical protein